MSAQDLLISPINLTPSERLEKLKSHFSTSLSAEDKFKKIMTLGQNISQLEPDCRTEENLVKGCQSIVYLNASLSDQNTMQFKVYSEALISSGLAALLIYYYNDLPPEVILQSPPVFIESLGLTTSLSPGRSNGLASMHSILKQKTLKIYLENNKNFNI